ncbi:pyruvate/2-oxoglutarate dehydrogenase complex, dihydrolipoamide acyltransferase (E2) component [Bacteroidales bacterium 6E]|nr:pyruvate/2-oxoglutarate dehydrogenase complex, dihydrolipoamide acyltransferase (E2) component [Bacteroidales bacterium 6E]
MAEFVIMPRQGQSVETCILGQWYKEVGDTVKSGDLLFSYETDKAAFDEEAKSDGVLLAIFYNPGDEVPVLANIGLIGEAGEEFELPEQQSSAETPEASDEVAKVIEFSLDPDQGGDERIRISPLARNMAIKLGVDYTVLEGTGPQGRIIARDVESYSLNEKSYKTGRELYGPDEISPINKTESNILPENIVLRQEYDLKPLTNIRKLIAKSMHQSLQNSAQLTHHLSADARKLLSYRKKFKADFQTGKISENITINDMVCYAVIRSLKKFPQVNAHFMGDQMKIFRKVNLGFAVDTDRGLMVPALKDADDLSIGGLSNQLGKLADNCRKGNINPDLLNPEAASFTVSNLGNYGVEIFTPVINLPQTAILGVNTIIPRPMDLGDGVYGFVPMIGLSLTYDHRALDGGEATRFLSDIAREIENLVFVS